MDFHYYQIVNIYEDENAYWSGSDWVKVERPNARLHRRDHRLSHLPDRRLG